jgi:hypothetical protein
VEREKEQDFLKTPLTLVLSRKGREEMEGKNLKAPLTFILSRKGREEMNGKLFQRTPHPDPLPQGERFDEEKRI